MTVYNITKLSPNTAKAIAKYYEVDKVSLRYSNWGNKFGAAVKDKADINKIPIAKRLVVQKYLNIKFGNMMSINVLKSYSKIERNK